MPIPVVCPGCKASFRVSDKFAGKQGPCPKCKAIINVPMVEEVKIHVPEPAPSSKAARGTGDIKPIRRKETKLSPVAWAALVGSCLGVTAVALVMRAAGGAATAIAAVGLPLISPALAVGCYSLLRDDELEPHRGLTLWIRATICGLVYALLWAAFVWLLPIYVQSPELWVWMFVAPPFFLVGALAALACFDLDYGTGVVHYGFYALVTALLGMIAGVFPPQWVTG